MTQTLLFILVIAIGFAYSVKYGNKAKKEITEHNQVENKTEQNHYNEMRKIAFSVTSEQLGLNTISKDKVYGIVSEMNMQGVTVTIVTFITGDSSIYLSSGAIIIGAGQHESVKNITMNYVKNGQNYLEKAIKTESTNLPKIGMNNFNFLTQNGIYKISESLSELESGKSEYSNLFMNLNEVITEIRIKSEK